MHLYGNTKDADKLKKMVGDNPIADGIGKDKHEKYEMFEAIDTLVSSARDLYCDEELSWEEMCECLCEAIDKVKGKEKALKAMVPKKDEDEEE